MSDLKAMSTSEPCEDLDARLARLQQEQQALFETARSKNQDLESKILDDAANHNEDVDELLNEQRARLVRAGESLFNLLRLQQEVVRRDIAEVGEAAAQKAAEKHAQTQQVHRQLMSQLDELTGKERALFFARNTIANPKTTFDDDLDASAPAPITADTTNDA
jgi:hypothetical protein